MRFFSFSSGLALLAAALLAGCCANNTCDCQDELEDAIQLRFKTSDTTSTRPTGFRLAELDTIRIVRYRLNSTATDTVVRTRRKAEADKALVISPETPFNPNSSARPGLYRFAVLEASDAHFEGREIEIASRADGCAAEPYGGGDQLDTGARIAVFLATDEQWGGLATVTPFDGVVPASELEPGLEPGLPPVSPPAD